MAEAMTADEFERAYAARSGVTVEWLRAAGRVVVRCACGEPECEGWASVSREGAADYEPGGIYGRVPSGPIPLHPEWPKVRCTNCGHVYEPDTSRVLLVGDCPRCHCVTYNTAMPMPVLEEGEQR